MLKHILCCAIFLGWLNGQAQTADFTADRTSGCAGLLTVSFTSTSTGNINTYSWNFGDGGSSILQNPAHTYTSPGNYTVVLTVSGPGGSNTKTIPNYITVYAVPQATFSISNDTVCDGIPVTLNSFSIPGTGAIVQCLWTFNDGSPADTACPSITHTFINGSTSVRTFFPNLLIVDQYGCTSVSNETLIVNPRPTASFNFTVSTPCTAPSTVNFNNTSTVTNQFIWDFGITGSGSDTSTQRSPQYTYTTPGSYTVTLFAGVPGCSSSVSQIVQLEDPQADFITSDTIVCKGTIVSFISSGSTGNYSWNFGDPNSNNNTANGDTVSHSFDTPGVFTVTTNLSAGGCTDIRSVNITVLDLPSIWLVADDRKACSAPHLVQFHDSTNAASSWSWDFGDPASGASNTSTLENPSHSFNAFGSYTISLTVTDTNGCMNSRTYLDYILVAPVIVDFNLSDSGCLGKNFSF
ncbi:MAG: PKD domain-containing protein, partial [Bacteroidota bacterium]